MIPAVPGPGYRKAAWRRKQGGNGNFPDEIQRQRDSIWKLNECLLSSEQTLNNGQREERETANPLPGFCSGESGMKEVFFYNRIRKPSPEKFVKSYLYYPGK